MIVSTKGRFVEEVAAGRAPKGFPADIVSRAERRLRALHYAEDLNDLRSPPGNHLEKLFGDRQGQHSIRINDQWRICFRWTDAGAEDVEIVDYH
jgi:proteic killer suppression protein